MYNAFFKSKVSIKAVLPVFSVLTYTLPIEKQPRTEKKNRGTSKTYLSANKNSLVSDGGVYYDSRGKRAF